MYFYGIGSSNPFHDLDVIYPLPKEMVFLFERQPSEMEVLGQPPVMIVGLVTSHILRDLRRYWVSHRAGRNISPSIGFHNHKVQKSRAEGVNPLNPPQKIPLNPAHTSHKPSKPNLRLSSHVTRHNYILAHKRFPELSVLMKKMS